MTGAIYVDFDDVLCETARSLSGIVASRFGKHTRFEDIYSFDLDKSFGLNPAEQQSLFALFHDARVLQAIPPVPGAVDGMRAWAAAGCAVQVVTGRPPETQAASHAWLEAHGMPYAGITFVDKYGRGHGTVPEARQMTLAEIGACTFDLAVDDSPDMVRFLAAHACMPIVVFDRPWNSGLEEDGLRPDVVRCRNWAELMQKFPQPGNGARKE